MQQYKVMTDEGVSFQTVREHVTAPVTRSLAVTSVGQERRCQTVSKVTSSRKIVIKWKISKILE